MGRGSRDFVDFLAEAGQSWWQMLPINPIDRYNSPYASISSFAGEPLFIDMEDLVAEKLLAPDDVDWVPAGPMNQVAYAAARDYRESRLRKAFERYRNGDGGKTYRLFHDKFLEDNAFWIQNHAIFCALANYFGTQEWPRWPDQAIRRREEAAVLAAGEELADEIAYHVFLQLVFDVQWNRLREYCREKNVGLIGDVPIYVAAASADTWGNARLFQQDDDGNLLRVAGVPGDSFNPTGQRWDAPLYNWDVHENENFQWWLHRMQLTLHRFDAVRLDHFIGFYNYFSLPSEEDPLDPGEWLPGPGAKFFEAVLESFPNARLIAEDLGVMHEGVLQLRDRFSFPGINVLQFHFDWRHDGDPTRDWAKNSIVCTGTHDTNTIMGWLHDVRHAGNNGHNHWNKEYLLKLFTEYIPDWHHGEYPSDHAWDHTWDHIAGEHAANEHAVPTHQSLPTHQPTREQICDALIRMVMTSPGNVAIFPMQDILGLGSTARMNFPGTSRGNWNWRLNAHYLTKSLAETLHAVTETSSRILKPNR